MWRHSGEHAGDMHFTDARDASARAAKWACYYAAEGFWWCEGLTQQLVSNAGSISDDRHQLDVSVRQLGKVKEELRGTDTHTSVPSPLPRCVPALC